MDRHEAKLRDPMSGEAIQGASTFEDRRRARGMLLLLVSLCLLVRGLQWYSYEPLVAPDTGTYARFADQIARWDFSEYDGTRTPGYPLLLLLAGNDSHRLWHLQSALGVGTSILLFLIVLHYSRSPLLALVGGLVYTLSLNLLYFEAALLTEPVSTFLLVLSVWLFSHVIEGEHPVAAAGALGATGGVVALTHPLFAFSGLLFASCVFLFARRRRLLLASIVALVAMAPLVTWMTLNQRALGTFTITTYTGFNLTNHSGGFMELAPPSQIRDIYLEYREIKRAETGRHSMTIYLAREEMQRRTGLSMAQLSSELTRISIALFREHPLLYFRSVAEQWLGFWAVPSYWRPELFTSAAARRVATTLWGVEHWVLRGVNLLFVLLCVPLLLKARHGPRAAPSVKLFATVALLVLATSAVQALFEFGNTRYSIPTQALVGCTTVFLLHALRSGGALTGGPAPQDARPRS